MSNQVALTAEPRTEHGKGPAGRLRRTGRVPAIVYGFETDANAIHVDALELYHALHTEAGRNVLIRLEVSGDTTLVIARDLQTHPVRGEVLHVDFYAVDQDAQISVEVPVHLVNEDDVVADGGILNQILYTVPMAVKPLDVPNSVEIDVAGMAIGDVRRVEDLAGQLPAGADLEIDLDRTVVTINAPITEEELEEMEAEAGVEHEEPEVPEIGEAEAADAEEAATEGEDEDEGEG